MFDSSHIHHRAYSGDDATRFLSGAASPLEYLTTHEAQHPRAGIRPLGGALFRGVVPHQRGHVGVNLPSLHDAFANQVVKALSFFMCLSHASNIACDESDGPYEQAGIGGSNNSAAYTRSGVFDPNGTPWTSGYTSVLPIGPTVSARLNYPRPDGRGAFPHR